jgi:hypothetical protein
MHILVAAALLLAAVPLRAATIGGRLGYPSEELPGMTVVARNAAGATFAVETRPKQARYRLEVPGAATWCSRSCAAPATRRRSAGATSNCSARATRRGAWALRLEEVTVTPARGREDVDITTGPCPRRRGDAAGRTVREISR